MKKSGDDLRFKSAYSKALAQAILENEDLARHSSSNNYSMIAKETYVALCYDEPIVQDTEGSFILCMSILASLPTSSFGKRGDQIQRYLRKDNAIFALSDPLVNSVINLTCISSSSPSVPPDVTIMKTHESSSGNSCVYEAGYAALAYSFFALGPCLCCAIIMEESNASSICSFLGSYNGRNGIENYHTPTPLSDDPNCSTPTIGHGISNIDEGLPEQKKDNLVSYQNEYETSSMEEVFADSEDADDYDFSSPKPTDLNCAVTEEVQSFDVFDPSTLSKSKSLSLYDVQCRLKCLIGQLSYSRLAAIDSPTWKEWKVSSTLTRLALTLLKLRKNSDESDLSIYPLSGSYLRPIMVLRDRALDPNYGHNELDDFLQIIQILLASKSEDVGSYASKSRELNSDIFDISPARAIGLTLLSHLCYSDEVIAACPSRIKLRDFILHRSLKNLIDCIECVRSNRQQYIARINNRGTENYAEVWIRVGIAIQSVIDFLTNVKCSDFTLVGGSNAKYLGLEYLEAQSIRQGGLFRELIFFYLSLCSADNEIVMDTTLSVICQQLLRGLFVMSSQAADILGKYIIAVPELNQRLSPDFFREHLVDAIVWLSFVPTSPKKIVQQNENTQIIQKIISKGTINLCERSICSLSLTGNQNRKESENNKEEALLEFLLLANSCNNIHLFAKTWVSILTMNEVQNIVKDLIVEVGQSAAFSFSLQISKKHTINTHRSKTMIAKVQKSAKSLLIFLEETGNKTD